MTVPDRPTTPDAARTRVPADHADRPRYRALARRWVDTGSPDATGGPATGIELEVYRTDHPVPPDGVPLTTVVVRDGLLPTTANDLRAAVVAWVHAASAPRPSRTTQADVELFLEAPR